MILNNINNQIIGWIFVWEGNAFKQLYSVSACSCSDEFFFIVDLGVQVVEVSNELI